jgi:uncharacterized membrane protein
MLVMSQAISVSGRPAGGIFDLRWMALVFFSTVLVDLAATVLLAAAGRPEAIAFYAAFGAFCHQQIERTWMLASQPLPVCVRCFGFYLGAFAAAASGVRFSRRLLWLSIGIALLTFGAEISGLWAAPSTLRWLSGALLGWSLISPISGRAAASSTVSASHG